MAKTFANPLKPKRTDFSFTSGVFDYKAIREAAAPNPFGIVPDPPTSTASSVAKWSCDAEQCSQWRDENGVYYGKCEGLCGVG